MWQDERVQFLLFFAMLGAFYWIAASVLINLRDNYRRHYQKSRLQWTGPDSEVRRGRLGLLWIILAAALSAAFLVRYVF